LLAVGPDDDIYCQICCDKISWPGNYAGASDTTLITGDDGEPTNCPRCSGKVNLRDYPIRDHSLLRKHGLGFFEPPTCLKTDAEKTIVNALIKHYCVYYLFFASVFTFVSLF
jgi:hypothetical protein